MSDFHHALHPESRIVHPPVEEVTGSRPLGVPLHQGHVFAFPDSDALAHAFTGPGQAFLYNRYGNPTVRSLENAVADLEGGAGALATASGMGVINTVLLALLRSGDHVIAQRSLYGGTFATLADLAERWGVEVTHVGGDDPEEVRAALRPTTRLLHLETVSNPTTRVTDLPALIGVAREAGVLSVVDNTFATPLICRPIEHGADIVVHSATKYLGGHSDVLAGVAVFADAELHRRVWQHAIELGSSLDPFAAWLTLRGMQTLGLRLRRHCETASDLAGRLAAHPAVTTVHYPGLPAHPDHELARRLLPDGQGGVLGGGVLAFDLAGGRDAARTFTESVRLAALAPSLGGVHTLVMHPASTSHRQLDDAELTAAGISPGTVRVAVGIEHPEDLWADLEQALAKL
ncbi:aminotransferase class I/II-fold pyridoxal phosphate-dependent enzyme [Streptomyces sp. BE20]|uniref:trans-sulfuration enzyme family protein n=1 Tax=Streptomyces sp. BE20 TaxID=3002525 RepID=UPI002E769716|nr:aminotransferase class I/II-fold pyridoxal phosphate-dependent enzyme [Streptomyces sp. BE20]MEE1824943.1 aminotransferase class I/II-fold pyridoxal phosphate-dependent enzyme [Streptomyces sp. BE20]